MRKALLLASLILYGCGSVAPEKGVVLRVANWGGAGDDGEFYTLVRKLYEEFEAENPGIKIQVEGIPGSQEYVSKVLLSHVAHSAPDIITLDASSSAVFIENNVLRDLTPYIESDREFKLDDYYPNVLDIARRGEALYAIPGDFTPMVVYYNKQLFDEAEVAYPNPNWNRAEFLQTARALTKDGKHGFVFTTWMPGWIMWLWNSGGDVFDMGDRGDGGELGDPSSNSPSSPPSPTVVLDSPQNIDTVTWLRDLITKHQVSPSLSATAAQGVDPFANGTAAMQVSGHWAMVGLKAQKNIQMDRLGVVPMPSENGRSQTVMYESGFAIGKYCKNPEAAWKFIKFMTSYEVQKRYNATGIAICARKDVSQERAIDPLEKSFIDIVPNARGPWGAKIVGYDLVEEIGQKMMDSVMKNGVKPSVALRKAAEEIRVELGKR